MKRIHFDRKIDLVMLAILLAAMFCYAISFFGLFGFNGEQTKIFATLGGLLNAVAITKVFFYKNYVRWNSNAITIRLNSFSGYTIPFAKIEAFEFSDSSLIITKRKSRKRIEISTSKIAEEDLQKLNGILFNHTQTRKASQK